jgi:putative transcriptional regulator
MTIKINLISLMAEKNFTPKQLSEKSGLSIQTINQMMNNQKSQLGFPTIAALCSSLECEIGELLLLEREVV